MGERKYGWRRDLPNRGDARYSRAHLFGAPELPPVVSLRSQCPPVDDQQQTSSCVGHGTSAAFDFLELREYKTGEGNEQFGDYKYDPVSRLFVYFGGRAVERDTEHDAGCQIRDAIAGLQRWGACKEATWPFNPANVTEAPSRAAYAEAEPHRRLKPYLVENTSLGDMLACLAEGFPIIFGATLYESFEEIGADGLVPMPHPGEQIVGGHCMLIIGYDLNKRLFEVRNSWGESFGDSGMVWFPFSYICDSGLVSDCWTLRA